jgi:hypothetical protein
MESLATSWEDSKSSRAGGLDVSPCHYFESRRTSMSKNFLTVSWLQPTRLAMSRMIMPCLRSRRTSVSLAGVRPRGLVSTPCSASRRRKVDLAMLHSRASEVLISPALYRSTSWASSSELKRSAIRQRRVFGMAGGGRGLAWTASMRSSPAAIVLSWSMTAPNLSTSWRVGTPEGGTGSGQSVEGRR